MTKKLLLIIFLTIGVKTGFAQEDVYKEVLAVANSGYVNYLEKIPKGNESLYGFKNRDEFSIAKIGKPFRIFSFSEDFFSDAILSNKNYLIASDEWRVAVTVNNEFRVLITVAKMKGIWAVVGIGAAKLAGELGEFENIHPTSNQYGRILRVYQLDSEFLLISPDNSSDSIKGYFLNSAKITFERTNNLDSAYLFSELLDLIKNKIENN